MVSRRPQCLANVLVHWVFSTQDHVPLIRFDVEPELDAMRGADRSSPPWGFGGCNIAVTQADAGVPALAWALEVCAFGAE